MKMKVLWWTLFVGFGSINVYAAVVGGLDGIGDYLRDLGPWGVVATVDLLTALFVGVVWMWRDARVKQGSTAWRFTRRTATSLPSSSARRSTTATMSTAVRWRTGRVSCSKPCAPSVRRSGAIFTCKSRSAPPSTTTRRSPGPNRATRSRIRCRSANGSNGKGSMPCTSRPAAPSRTRSTRPGASIPRSPSSPTTRCSPAAATRSATTCYYGPGR